MDEEYSQIMTTLHQYISTNLSSEDFSEGYRKVDLKNLILNHNLKEDGLFIH